MHHHRTNRNPTMPPDVVIGRLLARRRIEEAGGCWLWTGAQTTDGYGLVMLGHRLYSVHRLAAHAWSGYDLNSRTMIRHHCDTPSCFNPSHLVEGTALQNAADAARRGRRRRGLEHPRAKLTAAQVLLVRRALATGQAEMSIARMVGVSQPTVNAIRHARSYVDPAATICAVEVRVWGTVYSLDIPEPVLLELIDRYGDDEE